MKLFCKLLDWLFCSVKYGPDDRPYDGIFDDIDEDGNPLDSKQ